VANLFKNLVSCNEIVQVNQKRKEYLPSEYDFPPAASRHHCCSSESSEVHDFLRLSRFC